MTKLCNTCGSVWHSIGNAEHCAVCGVRGSCAIRESAGGPATRPKVTGDRRITDALILYRRAAEAGNLEGQYAIAWMYQHGRGVPRSDAEAIHWYKCAAAQGHERARDVLRARGLAWPSNYPPSPT